MKKVIGFLSNRVFVVGVAIVAQLALMIVMLMKFQKHFAYFYAISLIISFAVTVYVLNKNTNPAYKLAWVVPILMFPIFGGIFYLVFGKTRLSKSEHKKLYGVVENVLEYYKNSSDKVLCELKSEDEIGASQATYLSKYAYSPIYRNTETTYYPLGEDMFEGMVEELKKAKHFIFLEYFIIQEGTMWNTILDILTEKVKEGVDVRLVYDDMGCIFTLPKDYDKMLEERGIKCRIFNKFIPVLSMRFNNRDHRKICVIDGNVGFTGGINLADEYINGYEKHGHWKDTAVKLNGDAVWNLTVQFLSMWGFLSGTNENYLEFKPDKYQPVTAEHDGYIQPFSDSPLDNECVGETVYLNMINKAQKYIYITTPYLIIDNEMVMALTIAAKNGIDVRIITPHIPDKWYVHAVTRAYYEMLISAGIKIYEYTPGFIHAKSFVCDDKYAVVGTINMDYRSLYLHFECGVLMCLSKSVMAVKEDFLKTMGISEKITYRQCKEVPYLKKIGRAMLKVFAPLM